MRDNAPWLVAITRNRRVENESLQDFIEKKRNMFVLQVIEDIDRENGMFITRIFSSMNSQ